MTESGGPIARVDHVGYVVTNLEQAVTFFVEQLGFRDLQRRGTLEDPDGDLMTRRFGVHPRAVGRYAFVGVGDDRVEFIEWQAPDRRVDSPRNSDAGGRHLALATPDLDGLSARLATLPGVVVRETNEIGFRYVTTPFGLEIQLIPA
jgi:catechol 2,3-dioxygenase-like lactoylglutathione lyase family enzyme